MDQQQPPTPLISMVAIFCFILGIAVTFFGVVYSKRLQNHLRLMEEMDKEVAAPQWSRRPSPVPPARQKDEEDMDEEEDLNLYYYSSPSGRSFSKQHRRRRRERDQVLPTAVAPAPPPTKTYTDQIQNAWLSKIDVSKIKMKQTR